MREELESLQRQVIRQERLAAIGVLVSGVAHELNNPLQAILGFAELLQLRDGPAAGDVARELALIQKESARASAIIRNLSRFSRQQTTEPSPVRLRDVVASVVELRQRKLEEERHRARCRRAGRSAGAGGLHRAAAGRAELRDQRRAGGAWTRPAPRAISIRDRRRGQRARASRCEDTGPGVPRGARGEAVPAVLHDQAGRRRHRPRACRSATASSSRTAAPSAIAARRTAAPCSTSSCRPPRERPHRSHDHIGLYYTEPYRPVVRRDRRRRAMTRDGRYRRRARPDRVLSDVRRTAVRRRHARRRRGARRHRSRRRRHRSRRRSAACAPAPASPARSTGRRRFDHMQQHTGQHVLSAAFDRLFGVRTESFHLGAASATIDLGREVTPTQIARGRRRSEPHRLGGPPGRASGLAPPRKPPRCRCGRSRCAPARFG